jgi:hypothetical protein
MTATPPTPPAKIVQPFDIRSIPKKPPAPSVQRRIKTKRTAKSR